MLDRGETEQRGMLEGIGLRMVRWEKRSPELEFPKGGCQLWAESGAPKGVLALGLDEMV